MKQAKSLFPSFLVHFNSCALKLSCASVPNLILKVKRFLKMPTLFERNGNIQKLHVVALSFMSSPLIAFQQFL